MVSAPGACKDPASQLLSGPGGQTPRAGMSHEVTGPADSNDGLKDGPWWTLRGRPAGAAAVCVLFFAVNFNFNFLTFESYYILSPLGLTGPKYLG